MKTQRAQQLKSYQELARTVIARGLSVPYRIWLLCRFLDRDGRGIVDRAALYTLLESYGLSREDFRNARRWQRVDPASGRTLSASIFFTVYPDRIEYHSLKSVCLALRVVPGRPVLISLQAVNSLETFNAHLYASWFAGQERNISRESLAGLFNVSDVTMRRWEAVTGLDVTFNVVAVDPHAPERVRQAAQERLPVDRRPEDRYQNRTAHIWRMDGRIYFRTVNTYSNASHILGRRGMARKVTKIVNAAGAERCGGAAKQRIFVRTDRLSRRYQEKAGDCVKFAGGLQRTRAGINTVWDFSITKPISGPAFRAM